MASSFGAIPEKLVRNAKSYEIKHNRQLNFAEPLGSGQDGAVWVTQPRRSAVKFFERVDSYLNEKAAYERPVIVAVPFPISRLPP